LDRFVACWDGLDDPRTGNAALHDFHEMLAIALCAVLRGGRGAVDMALFAHSKEPFLRGFLKLENGLPSHDTFSRLFRMLDPDQLRATFQRFMAEFSESCKGARRDRRQGSAPLVLPRQRPEGARACAISWKMNDSQPNWSSSTDDFGLK
jgi:hypothetical protein